MPDKVAAVLSEVVWVAAVALASADRRVLLQRRRPDRAHGGLWEFPGGKIEAGETPEAAAQREIREELGVDLDMSALQPVIFASDTIIDATAAQPTAHRAHVILLYACRSWRGEPACLDAAELGWFTPEEVKQLAMPPLDYPLARALKKVI